MDLLHFEDNENWLGIMVDGQPDDLDFGLSEVMEPLDIGRRHLGNQGIQYGLNEMMKKNTELDGFQTEIVVQWTLGVYMS